MVLQSKTADGITEQSGHRIGCAVFQSQNLQSADGKPPPLPPKKKHSKYKNFIFIYCKYFANNLSIKIHIKIYNIIVK